MTHATPTPTASAASNAGQSFSELPLSPAMLSKIERGRLFPTLPTLLRIALVFSVGLDHFFTAGSAPVRAVVRKSDRKRFPERPGSRQVAYHFESLDYPAENRPMNAYLVEFEDVPENARRPHHHTGVEMLYVIEGQLAVTFDDGEETVDAGDSMYFDANHPHSYHRVGKRRCSAVVVTAG